MSKSRKILLIILFILISIGIGFLIFIVFFKTQPNIIKKPKELPSATNGLPISGEGKNFQTTQKQTNLPTKENVEKESADEVAFGKLTKSEPLTKNIVMAPVLSKNGKDIYYYNIDGKFYHLKADGKVELLDDRVFHNVKSVAWAGNRKEAILEYPDGANIYYNFQTKRQVTLPKHWTDFAFSPDSKKIVFKSFGMDPENHWLAIAQPDGSSAKKIEQIIGGNIVDNWSPNQQIIAYWDQNLGFAESEVYFVGQHGENFKAMKIPGLGFRGIWSKKGDKMLYSCYNITSEKKLPELWIADAQRDKIGDNRRRLKLNTWADRCAFYSNDIIYCGVPKKLPDNSGLAPQLADNTDDEIYKIDLKTGIKTRVAIPDKPITVNKIMLTSDGKIMYIQSKRDGKLYKIRLK